MIKIYLFILMWPLFSFAKTASFEEVWKQIYSESEAKQAADAQKEAANIANRRSQLHWLPSLYVDAKVYSTDEPASSFVGLLQQAAVEASDFNPVELNKPKESVYTRAALGMQWSLYEGGTKQALSKIASMNAAIKNIESKQVELELYIKVAESYAQTAVFNKSAAKLEEISTQLKEVIKRFQIGSRSNPVGHLGLLGLKSLENRVQALLNQYASQLEANLIILRELGYKQENWTPESLELNRFIETKLTPSKSILKNSYALEQKKIQAEISNQAIDLQKGRFLPQVGLFAEAYSFEGDRKSDQGYTAGAYLRWTLFDSNHLGVTDEARLNALAASKMAQAYTAQDRAENQSLLKGLSAIKENLKLLESSEGYLIDQQKSVLVLFKNGSVNVLQLVEVLNRRVDIISQHLEAQKAALEISSSLLKKTDFTYNKNE